MSILHHPDDATLMSYAAGSLPEALSAVVATHLAMCRCCRDEVADMELLGSILMGDIKQTPTSRTVSRAMLHSCEADVAEDEFDDIAESEGDIRGPLARLIGEDLDDIPWKRLGFGVWHYPIQLRGSGRGDLRLLKVAPGQVMPEHGHGGSELTLLLRGSYRDEVGHFGVGDVADLDDEVEHTPVADPKEGCVCLIASEEKARFKSVFARMVQPLTGI
ncbi:MAG: ChrR family anti-sigma-E factor [Pseudomonadota bacterium]